LAPAAFHVAPGGSFQPGLAMCFLSDDEGQTWYQSQSELALPGSGSGLQEPGVVELRSGRLLMLCRTDQGCHYRSFSRNGGVTWSRPLPTDIEAPCSPAGITRIPRTGDLLLVWNDHSRQPELGGSRVPLTIAVSRDEGRTWAHRKDIETDPAGSYCYTAVEFVGDQVLLSYMTFRLASRMTLMDLDWLYQ
jgi:photosystem II stability/assembly factor-like uncharacterized protein